MINPYRRLWAAVILQAVLEARDAGPIFAAPARRWLAGEGAVRIELLDIPSERVVRWVEKLPDLPWEQLALLDEVFAFV
jgi:hypothetical protein